MKTGRRGTPFNKFPNQSGFTLMEVMIAITIFSLFIGAYMVAQGNNLLDSTNYNEELLLHNLCEDKINELIVNPPEFREAMTAAPDIKPFENHKNYQYEIEYKKLKIPDLAKIQGKPEDEEEVSTDAKYKKLVYDKMKKNLEEMVWQVKVTVRNKETKYHYSLTTWLYNYKAKIKMEI
ncbi:MAG: prepilin-type N-terminal cleavage/methylation domain-containing protein [Bacteriovoracaceae bacterium]|jgi:prepilin-type N-terminal cleavage/methylation domain-containing protein|nr:prepilin-type N-terminal cleavage/methylation domain-containing protein [Bacteriovoracaceae bacterium]